MELWHATPAADFGVFSDNNNEVCKFHSVPSLGFRTGCASVTLPDYPTMTWMDILLLAGSGSHLPSYSSDLRNLPPFRVPKMAAIAFAPLQNSNVTHMLGFCWHPTSLRSSAGFRAQQEQYPHFNE